MTLRRSGTHGRRVARAAPTTTRATFVQALVGDVLDVKAASVYLTLAPQFVTDRHTSCSRR